MACKGDIFLAHIHFAKFICSVAPYLSQLESYDLDDNKTAAVILQTMRAISTI